MKNLLVLALCLAFLNGSAQKKTTILEDFTNSFGSNFYPNQLNNWVKSSTNFFIPSLLIIQINNKYRVDSIDFSDSAPNWQFAKLQEIKSSLNLAALQEYAKQNKFIGKLVFPLILKSELVKGAIKEDSIYSIYSNFFKYKGKLLSGNIKMHDAIVVTAPIEVIP